MIEFYPAETTSISWYKQIPKQTYYRGEPAPDRFTHDYMLLSQFYFGKDNPREKFDIHPRVKLMGDSGGYQIFTQQVAAEPIHVLKWQEDYCSVGMTLDVPPDAEGARNHDYFLKCLDRTEGYVDSMARNRSESTPFDLKLLNVVQGECPSDVEVWMKRIMQYQDNFDGFAFPFRAGLPLDFIFWTVGRMIEEKPKRIHLLSATGYKLIPMLCFIAHRTDTIISVDSTSHSTPASAHKFIVPGGRRIRLGERNKDLTKMPCNCPTCSSINIEDIRTSRGSALGLLAMHNLWQSIEWLNMADALTADFEAFEWFLADDGEDELLNKVAYLLKEGAASYRTKYLDDGHDVRKFF
jgi:queuine/archaeosine tRNA-ribosyltransferase